MKFTVAGALVEAPDATTALRSVRARTAPKGSEFCDEDGTVLAIYERIEVDGDWLLAWRRTKAWEDRGHDIPAKRI
jgi:hypothetical protein